MDYNIKELQIIAGEIRKDIIRSLVSAGSGHTGGSLGLADVFTVLYFRIMQHKPQQPDWSARDFLILSIGHVAPVLYATLSNAGYFPKEELLTLRKLGSRLQGHPGRDHHLPGLECSAGSLGQGLSVAVGLALSAKMDGINRRVFSIHGDGELQEGSIWEAAMSAAYYKLDNLISLIDRNHCQIDGRTENVMDIEPLAKKWEAFGWNVLECDGNDISSLILSYEKALNSNGRPTAIIAHTLMGKGVKSIEDDYHWHGKAPSPAEGDDFIIQIEKAQS